MGWRGLLASLLWIHNVEEASMEPRREGILEELLNTVDVLPEKQLREVTDFASFLSQKPDPDQPQRGSAGALLKHAGSFRFGAGEMEGLLAAIDRSRESDIESDV